MGIAQSLSRAADIALDRSVVLGYTRIGSGLRSRWWPADPPRDALAGRRVSVTGATSGIGAAAVEGYLALGATVHLLGRNPAKVDDAVREAVARRAPTGSWGRSATSAGACAGEHAPGLVRDPGREAAPPALRATHPAAPAHHAGRRRHGGLARGDPTGMPLPG